MTVEISEFTEGAASARGIAVIIDVFRAFSFECYGFDAGASGITATNNVNAAFDIKGSYRKAVLAGERGEKKIEGFDFGNSPTEILMADIKGKHIIHTTTAGTNGLINATGADTVLAGSFVNAWATAEYIRSLRPRHVSLVAMGYRATESAEEDLLCAEYMESLLQGRSPDIREKIDKLRNTSGKRFFRTENLDFSPPTDFFLCTIINRFSFVLRGIRRSDGNIDILRTDI